jgi:hypothetical protein
MSVDRNAPDRLSALERVLNLLAVGLTHNLDLLKER